MPNEENILSAAQLKEMRRILKQAVKIDVGQYKDDFLSRQVAKRASCLQLNGMDYIRFLGKDSSERQRFIESLTVHHTSFFRDLNKYRALREAVFPDLLERKRKSKRIKIWSAGCASGEEPYSIGMVFREGMVDQFKDWNVDILASDMSESLLTIARQGMYPPDQISKNKINERIIKRYFNQEGVNPGNGFFVKDEIRIMVSFFNHNLIRDPFPERLDIIFCRNVLIYIKYEHAREILMRFHQVMNEGGYLFLGNFESLDSSFLASFERIRLFKECIYRKITPGSPLHRTMLKKQTDINAGLGIG